MAAGLVIIAALAVFALGRSLCSIASKDVQGRTIPEGQRGQINGLATTAAGVVAITLGVGIRVLGGEDLAAVHLSWALLFLAAMGLTGVVAGARLPDVSRR